MNSPALMEPDSSVHRKGFFLCVDPISGLGPICKQGTTWRESCIQHSLVNAHFAEQMFDAVRS